jgi:hypothetical protein
VSQKKQVTTHKLLSPYPMDGDWNRWHACRWNPARWKLKPYPQMSHTPNVSGDSHKIEIVEAIVEKTSPVTDNCLQPRHLPIKLYFAGGVSSDAWNMGWTC